MDTDTPETPAPLSANDLLIIRWVLEDRLAANSARQQTFLSPQISDGVTCPDCLYMFTHME